MDAVDMCTTSPLQIDLKALNDTVSTAEYELDDAYFQAIDAPDIKRGALTLRLSARKMPGFYELATHIEGVVYVPCDLCLEDMEQPICTDNKLVAKLGDENTEEDDLIVVAEEDGTLDISWYVYEFIALAVPIKHVHEPGGCDPAMIAKLRELSVSEEGERKEDSVDPRWAKLQALRTDD